LGDCLIWGSLFKITEVSHVFVLLVSNMVRFFRALIWTKNGFGHILGEFFTNSSGHPARVTFQRLSLIKITQSS
jgi:hypothetical protein